MFPQLKKRPRDPHEFLLAYVEENSWGGSCLVHGGLVDGKQG